MTVRIYQKIALMRAVQYDGTNESAEEIIAFMRDERGVLCDDKGNEISRREAGLLCRNDRTFTTGGITGEQVVASDPLFDDPEVLAVVWNDLHKYWNPLRVTDHVGRDSQGCFYPIAESDVIGSYTEVGEK